MKFCMYTPLTAKAQTRSGFYGIAIGLCPTELSQFKFTIKTFYIIKIATAIVSDIAIIIRSWQTALLKYLVRYHPLCFRRIILFYCNIRIRHCCLLMVLFRAGHKICLPENLVPDESHKHSAKNELPSSVLSKLGRF